MKFRKIWNTHTKKEKFKKKGFKKLDKKLEILKHFQFSEN